MLIHVCLPHMSVYISLSEDLGHIFWGFYNKGGQILHVHTCVLVSQVKLIMGLLAKKISNLFIIDFKIGCTDEELLLGIAANLLEDVFKSTRHDSFLFGIFRNSCDCVSLSSTSLTVCKDSTVVPLEHIFTYRIRCLSKDILLLRTVFGLETKNRSYLLPVIDRVKCEYFRHFILWFLDKDLSCL